MLVESNKCTGCSACYNVCSFQAISMEPDERGFLYPIVDQNKCVGCQACERICPILNLTDYKSECNEVYAAYSKDEEVRFQSTSGGVFTELANYILEQNGLVVGARYNEKHLVEHFMIDKKEDIQILRQSKYIQSDKKDIYRKIKEQLESKRKILFVGTPCECNALIHFVGGRRENLVLCDFICRGANSPVVYQKFLEELEKEYGAPVSRVWFKNKERGWESFSTRVEFANGRVYSKTREEDNFIRGYIEKVLYVRESCTDCKFKGKEKCADITLGDFWGIEKYFPDMDRTYGISMVLINSLKGKAILEQIFDKLVVRQSDYDFVVSNNGMLEHSVTADNRMRQFFLYMKKHGYGQAMQKFLKKNSMIKRAWYARNRIYHRFKQKIKVFMKINHFQNIYINNISKHVKKCGGHIVPFHNSIITFEEDAVIECKGTLQLNEGVPKRYTGYSTMLVLHKNAKIKQTGGVTYIGYGSDLRIFENAKLILGDFYCNSGLRLRCADNIKIGDGTVIGSDVRISDTDGHRLIKDGGRKSKPICIGNHVWIGANCTILKGVTIGDGAVIAAGTLVNKNVSPKTLMGGNPMKVLDHDVHWEM